MKRLSLIIHMMIVVVLFVTPALAITNGQPDGDVHPYVGLIVFDVAADTPGWRCSGSLIAPTIVLTSGACTGGTVAARVWFYEDVTENNVPFPLYPFGGPGSGAIEGTPYTNPDFCHGCGNGLPNRSHRDVGIVVLDEPVFMNEYAALPTAGLVDTLQNKTDIDFVGYGVQYQAQIPGNLLPQPPQYYRWTGPRVRMYAPSELISGNFMQSDEFIKLAMNPGGGTGGVCFGDGGGPTLLSGTNTVLAVNSYLTNNNCAGVGYSNRIDIPEILDWIMGYMP